MTRTGNSMTVLVTGATGFIGSNVVRELRARGHAVRASARVSSAMDRIEDVRDEVEWVPCDLASASPAELRRLSASVNACIHAAWYVEPGRYAHAPENVDWVGASLRLLEALAAEGCGRAVYVGTCFEYDHRQGYLSESSPTRPWTIYGAAKLSTWLLGEHRARRLGVDLAWARLFYQYGPHEAEGRLVPAVIRALLAGEEVAVTEGTQVRDFLHVADVGSALAAILESDRSGPVNIGSGRPITVRDVVECIARRLGARERVRFGARSDAPGDPPFICADNRVLREDVGWLPRFDLEEGMRDTIAWWKERAAGAPANESSIKA